jgi:putative ABC transport system permease protein
MGILFQIAVRNLIQSTRRTALLGSAIVAVTMLLVLLLSLSQGISENMIRSATAMSTGHVNVAGFFKMSTGQSAPIVSDASKVMAIVEKVVPDAVHINQRHRGWGKLISDAGSLQAGFAGVSVAEEPLLKEVVELAEEQEYLEGGRAEVLGDLARLDDHDSVMIFASQAKRLEVVVGDALTVTTETTRGNRNTADLTVVAIARDMGLLSSWTVFVPKSTLLNLYQLKPDTTGAIQIFLADPSKAEATMAELRRALLAEGYLIMDHQPAPFWAKFENVNNEDWTGQKLDLTIWEDEVSFLTWVVRGLDTLSFFLISILVFIISVGIMNTMIISVRERTREIGTLRAIGMSRLRVMLMILVEALVLGACASTLGAVGGALLALGLDAVAISVPVDAVRIILLSDTLHLAVNPVHIVAAILAFTVITGFAALIPAFRASRMQPVTAIQSI